MVGDGTAFGAQAPFSFERRARRSKLIQGPFTTFQPATELDSGRLAVGAEPVQVLSNLARQVHLRPV